MWHSQPDRSTLRMDWVERIAGAQASRLPQEPHGVYRPTACLLLLALVLGGCASGPLAEHDVEYGAGGYANATWRLRPESAGGEAGILAYPTPWLETHLGLSYSGPGQEDAWFFGFHGGARLEAPTRLSPFAGVGVFS